MGQPVCFFVTLLIKIYPGARKSSPEPSSLIFCLQQIGFRAEVHFSYTYLSKFNCALWCSISSVRPRRFRIARQARSPISVGGLLQHGTCSQAIQGILTNMRGPPRTIPSANKVTQDTHCIAIRLSLMTACTSVSMQQGQLKACARSRITREMLRACVT